jgi:phosphate/sulfate permease
MTTTYPERTIAAVLAVGKLSVLGGLSPLFSLHSVSILPLALILLIIGVGAIVYGYKIMKTMGESEWNYRV